MFYLQICQTADDIVINSATLIIAEEQLSLQDVEKSQSIVKVRIHVERVKGLLKYVDSGSLLPSAPYTYLSVSQTR